MATATTTPELIRTSWVSLIRALAPAKHSGVPFRASSAQLPLDQWAEENPQACLRVFDVTDTTEREDPSFSASNQDLEEATYSAELIVAYPHNFALYGVENLRDLHDMARQDADQIRKAIGINAKANYVAGEMLCDATYSLEPGETVTLVVFAIEARYYFDISSV